MKICFIKCCHLWTNVPHPRGCETGRIHRRSPLWNEKRIHRHESLLFVFLCHIATPLVQSYFLPIALLTRQSIITGTKYLHILSTEQCLASSELLTPHPLSTQRVCPPPAPKAGWGVNGSEDARHRIGLLQYNSSTLTHHFLHFGCRYFLMSSFPWNFRFQLHRDTPLLQSANGTCH
jgi:hypothetical protein